MAHAPEHEPHKRKRDTEDDGSHPAHRRQWRTPSPSRLVAMAPESIVNFLTRPNAPLLPFLPGDVNIFDDIIYILGEYDGVLDRKESLAANLGAKLVGPRFLRGLGRFFEGPIKTIPPNPHHQITWQEIVTFAKTNPEAFTAVPLPSGSRCCRFVYNGVEVEIMEDDWRLIFSGALDRFPLEHTFEEDEAAELATLEILEQRASYLRSKADELASRARVLHQRLELRVHHVARRQQSLDTGSSSLSSSSSSHSGFKAINHPPLPAITSPGGGQYDIRSDLLRQFTIAATTQNSPTQGPPPDYHEQPASPNGASVAGQRPLALPSLEAPPYHPPPAAAYPFETAAPAAALISSSGPAPVQTPASTPAQASTFNSESIANVALIQVALPGGHATEVHRPIVLQKTDTLNKGEIIYPPCDRCRRLHLQCVKHLTACRGCTKKHARCSWKSVTDDEAADVKEELEMMHNAAKKASAALVSEKMSGKTTGSIVASQGNVENGSVSGPAAEPPRRLLPTTRLTRIDPAPTVPRSPRRTGQLAAILSPPDYEPRPFGTIPELATR